MQKLQLDPGRLLDFSKVQQVLQSNFEIVVAHLQKIKTLQNEVVKLKSKHDFFRPSQTKIKSLRQIPIQLQKTQLIQKQQQLDLSSHNRLVEQLIFRQTKLEQREKQFQQKLSQKFGNWQAQKHAFRNDFKEALLKNQRQDLALQIIIQKQQKLQQEIISFKNNQKKDISVELIDYVDKKFKQAHDFSHQTHQVTKKLCSEFRDQIFEEIDILKQRMKEYQRVWQLIQQLDIKTEKYVKELNERIELMYKKLKSLIKQQINQSLQIQNSRFKAQINKVNQSTELMRQMFWRQLQKVLSFFNDSVEKQSRIQKKINDSIRDVKSLFRADIKAFSKQNSSVLQNCQQVLKQLQPLTNLDIIKKIKDLNNKLEQSIQKFAMAQANSQIVYQGLEQLKIQNENLKRQRAEDQIRWREKLGTVKEKDAALLIRVGQIEKHMKGSLKKINDLFKKLGSQQNLKEQHERARLIEDFLLFKNQIANLNLNNNLIQDKISQTKDDINNFKNHLQQQIHSLRAVSQFKVFKTSLQNSIQQLSSQVTILQKKSSVYQEKIGIKETQFKSIIRQLQKFSKEVFLIRRWTEQQLSQKADQTLLQHFKNAVLLSMDNAISNFIQKSANKTQTKDALVFLQEKINSVLKLVQSRTNFKYCLADKQLNQSIWPLLYNKKNADSKRVILKRTVSVHQLAQNQATPQASLI